MTPVATTASGSCMAQISGPTLPTMAHASGPNLADCPLAIGTSPKVTVDGNPVLVVGSMIPASVGPPFAIGAPNGFCDFLDGGRTTAGGRPVIRMTDTSLHNGGIFPGTVITPSQSKVVSK